MKKEVEEMGTFGGRRGKVKRTCCLGNFRVKACGKGHIYGRYLSDTLYSM
jgi:hypothetical protein